MKKCFILLIAFLSISTSLYAGVSGKIKGNVTDENGEPLAGANIVIQGTTMGAESDGDGYYFIIGVRSGSYEVKCQFVGYTPITQKLQIRTGLTSQVDFKLTPTNVELKELIFTAKKVIVQKDITTSQRTTSSEVMDIQVVANVTDVVANDPGVKEDSNGNLHFRGGRGGEVSYQIDGVDLNDPTAAKANPTDINSANIEEITVIKGVPPASYGNALSGSVNLVLKIGDQEKTSGRLKYSTDSFLNEDNSLNYDHGEFSLSGPVPFFSSKIKPTYFIATDFSLEDGMSRAYHDVNTGDLLSYDDYDLANLGFKLPERRLNKFNLIAKLAYDISPKIDLTASYTGYNTHVYDYENQCKYTPETTHESQTEVNVFNVNFKQVIDQKSFYNLIFSYFNRKHKSLPGGHVPTDFTLSTEQDVFATDDDLNGDGIQEGGNGEGFKDVNKNGYFDREYFVDSNNDHTYNKPEWWYDENGNGRWDGDILFDSNGNDKWDYWESGMSYDGFSVTAGSDEVTLTNGSKDSLVTIAFNGSISTKFFEGYKDVDGSGHYQQNAFSTTDTDEAYIDGDQYLDCGEPFIDELRWYHGEVSTLYGRDGIYNEKAVDIEVDSALVFNDPNLKGKITFHYEPEIYWDLPTSSKSETQLTPVFNNKYNTGTANNFLSQNGFFDEFEAYCIQRPYGDTGNVTPTPVDKGDYIEFIGTYVIARIPKTFFSNPINAKYMRDDDGYAKWEDSNGNHTFDRGNQQYDLGESYSDYNQNGKWNKKDEFLNPGMYDRWASYTESDNTVIKVKGDYSNQINKAHLLKTGFEVVSNDLYYFDVSYTYRKYSTGTGAVSNGPYPTRGLFRTFYNFKPIEFSYYLQDKMEFEDLIVNIGMRMDMLHHDDAAVDYYNSRRNEGALGYEDALEQTKINISPRFGISHSISETAKLFFSYGHMYQLPTYTRYYTPDTQGAGTFKRFGNMNLNPEKNVLYELGVTKEYGDYLLDVTGYFKDIYDLINTKKITQSSLSANIFYNSDYGKSRGVEISIDKKLSDHYTWNAAYTLSYAYGKSSSEFSNYNAAFNGEEVDVKEFPLDWDQRHNISLSSSIVFAKDEKINDLPFTNNWSLTVSTNLNSGLPFTPTTEYYNDTKSAKDIETNDERMPWTENTDLKLVKKFSFSNEEKKSDFGTLSFEFEVFNLFNRVNVLQVYAATGSWQKASEDLYNSDTAEFYKDPTRIAERRHFKLSMGYSW